MKHIFLFLFTILIYCVSYAQLRPDRLRTKLISLSYDGNQSGEPTLPFNFIKVIDSRYDTSKIGFLIANGGMPESYQKINLKNGLCSSLQQYLSACYHLPNEMSGTGLMLAVKKFWFSQHEDEHGGRNGFGRFYFSCDMYVVRGEKYLPYKKIDTVVVVDDMRLKRFIKGNSEENTGTLEGILKTILVGYNFTAAISVLDQRPGKTLEEIVNYNNKRFDLPVLKNEVPNAGVYLTFSSFLQNRPDIMIFREDSLSIRGSKKQFSISDSSGANIARFWAYSNGKKVRVAKKENPVLYRAGNAFEYFLVRDEQHATMGRAGALPVPIVYNERYLIPYQIDMETGQTY